MSPSYARSSTANTIGRTNYDAMLDLTNFIFGEPQGKYLAWTKAALQMIGTCEYDTVLPPQQPLDDERAELRAILEELGEL